ncbi:MAG: T9SS type A sorting domain-containing protein [Bacteroidia bacterium]
MKTNHNFITLAFVCVALFANAQNGHWRTTGNPVGGLDGAFPPTTNFIGTDNTNPNWIQLGVHGNQDIFIDNLTGAPQLLFYDVNGKQIQNVNITTKGKGQLNVYANDLTNGVYSYTLIVDGKIIDTKKMVKQQ